MAHARHGCLARRSSSSMGTLRLVQPDKPSRLANLGGGRGGGRYLQTILMGACFAHPTGFAYWNQG